MAASMKTTTMTLTRRLQIALFTPIFGLAFGVVLVACALDRLLRFPHPFPRDPRALARRRAWCLRALTAAGALPAGARVTAYGVTPFKRGEAFRSSLARVVVDYDAPDGQPARFEALAKFAPVGGGLVNRAVFVLQRLHLNEVGFYTHAAPAGDLPVPRAFYARAAPLTGNFCVLLERVPAVVEHTEEGGCPVAAARDAVAALATLHARRWGHRAPFPPPVTPFTIDFACSLAWGRRRRVLRHLARASWHQGNTPQTLLHGDARVGNMLFAPPPAPDTPAIDPARAPVTPPVTPPVTLIDWQAVRWGRAAFDLTYFLLLSLDSATREAHEDALATHYHAALRAAGVTDYPLDALREDMRHALVLVGSLLVVPLLGGEITVDADNAVRVLSGALVWNQRLVRALGTLDTAWLEARYGVDGPTLRATVAYTARHPPRLNRGAVLVARHIAAHPDALPLPGSAPRDTADPG